MINASPYYLSLYPARAVSTQIVVQRSFVSITTRGLARDDPRFAPTRALRATYRLKPPRVKNASLWEAFSYPLLFIRPVISSAQTARAGAPGKTHKITTSALSRVSRYRAGVESG